MLSPDDSNFVKLSSVNWGFFFGQTQIVERPRRISVPLFDLYAHITISPYSSLEIGALRYSIGSQYCLRIL
jgi:hypothetical protein